ncbi:MAG TPA: thioredoxin domain-containing protein [Nitrososphaerales archaeon]|nr:thioredoxin domain-containing protein [Nitrososphaerales archaeon]
MDETEGERRKIKTMENETKKDNRNSEQKLNHLASEKSPYLLQHAYNPVDWYPWGEEAFKKARTENKPIFLSIGYSTCHWCHVQAHESFEDPEIAALLNDSFVCIKVDREERPDVDEIYMKAVQTMTGSGGWPLNIFLTPRLEPFYGGTYFPPVARYGIPGFASVIRSISQAWKSDRRNLVESASQLKSVLSQMYSTPNPSQPKVGEFALDDCFIELANLYDREYGGFGSAPKFPTPSNLSFLMRYYKRTGQRASLQMAVRTLNAMATGGIYDQIGGGFHRYSTDRYWLVPHFEKMLYDNALLVQAYAEGYLLTKEQSFAKVVDETLRWILREMVSTGGGYYSAQDADSPDGGEGAYYVWKANEIAEALGAQGDKKVEELNLILRHFGVSEEGNFESGKSILTISGPQRTGVEDSHFSSVVEDAREKLLQAREQRKSRPMTDDKILTAWNGLTITAMSKAFQVFDNQEYLDSARKAADFILSNLVVTSEKNEEGEKESGDRTGRDASDKEISRRNETKSWGSKMKLMRRYRDGEVKGDGVLEDYAFFGNSLIDLYESSFEPRYLRTAISICDSMIERFYDERNGGGFFEVGKEVRDLIARPKDAYDGAMPSGNSIAAMFCLRVAEITSNENYREKSQRTFEAFWPQIEAHPSSFTGMLVALDFALGNPKEIVVSGDLERDDTRMLLRAIRNQFLPNSVILHSSSSLEREIPLIEGRVSGQADTAKVYVCTNFACKLPAKTKEELSAALQS